MTVNTPAIDKPFSLYLDITRFIAACLVVLAHLLQYRFIQGPLARFVPDLGREAVIVFFVLSGFVIAYTTEYKQQSAGDYITARCARIYSVAAPALLLSFVGAGIASALFGAQIENAYEVARPYVYMPFHLLFLGELWTLSDTPPWLKQYWSLGYEVWYYVLFGVLFYMRGARRLAAGALVFAVIGYKLWLLLPVWLSGVWLYHAQKKLVVPQTLARVGWCLTLVLLAAYDYSGAEAPLRALGGMLWPFPNLPLGSADRFIADYVVCAIVLANFMCARYAGFARLLPLAHPIRIVSSYTFTLYLAHALVVGAWTGLRKADGSPLELVGVTAAIVAFTWAVAQITEKRKDTFQAFFNGCRKALQGKRRPAVDARIGFFEGK